MSEEPGQQQPPAQQPPAWQPPPWPPPPPYGAPPGWQPPQQPPPPPYGMPPGQWQPPYGAPPYSGYPRPGSTNGYAIASLVCSIGGIVFLGVGGVLGIIFAVLGMRQIERTGERGRGLAIAGLVVGIIAVLIWVLVGVAALVGTHSTSGGGIGALARHGSLPVVTAQP